MGEHDRCLNVSALGMWGTVCSVGARSMDWVGPLWFWPLSIPWDCWCQ